MSLRSIRTWAPARLKDFVAVGRVAFNSTMLVVNARMPVNSATELAALTRQNPGRITIAITGIGSVSHLGRNGRAEPVLLGEVFGCRDLQS